MAIMETKDLNQKIIKLFVAGFLLAAIGFLLVEWLPLNKRVWSPSYALVTCGLAAMLQAALLYFIDAQGRKHWCRFFEVFGVNPLFLYVLSELTAVVLNQQPLPRFRRLFAPLCRGDGSHRLSALQEEDIH